MTTTDSPWVGTAEAAAYLGCHPDTLIRWLADGRALPVSPPWRIGRHGQWRWNRGELERFAGGAR